MREFTKDEIFITLLPHLYLRAMDEITKAPAGKQLLRVQAEHAVAQAKVAAELIESALKAKSK